MTRYIQLNAEFQRIARRDKKAFFSEQCIKLEENNRRGKTRHLLGKTGNIKGTFCPKMGTIKNRNGRDLIEAEEIQKRWKEYMEELYKKDVNEQDYYDVVISHPEPDILECEVKWLGSTAVNKANGCDGIPVELFKTLKDDAIKVLHSACQQIWKTQQWPQDWKRSILFPILKKDSTKECANHQTISLISHASKIILKILYARLQHYVNQEFPNVQVGFTKVRRTIDQIANICGITEKARKFQKNIYHYFIDNAKTFDYVDHSKLWKALKEEGNARSSYLSPEKTQCGSRSNS